MSHYDVLGVKRDATTQEVKSAYRRIVLRHHPDRSSAPSSKSIFLAATEAYEVLSDFERRQGYDAHIDLVERKRLAAEAAKRQPPPQARPQAAPKPKSATVPLAQELSRLTLLYNRGKHDDAEKLARKILAKDPKQAIPYAILGDLMRGRGNMNEAQKMYAYAAQMDPRNPIYERRYEQLLAASQIKMSGKRAQLETRTTRHQLTALAGGVTFMSSAFLALNSGRAVLEPVSLVSTWTLAVITLLFLCGAVTGACMALANLIDRFEIATTTSTGKLGPSVALGMIAIVNFWVAAAVYGIAGWSQRSFNYTTTRLVGAVAAIVLTLALGSAISGGIDGWQVTLWGGNLVYLGALIGWLVADSLRG